MKQPIVYAHRGASGYAPENTLAAFYKGIELGANGIETDVQLSRDGEVVIIHDITLDRTTNGSGQVGDYTLEQLQALDAGSWYGEAFSGERIPSLKELLDLVCEHKDVTINIELKNSRLPYKGLEERVLELVTQAGLEKRTIISSFNHDSLLVCKQLNPDVKTGLLYQEDIHDFIAYAKRFKVDALHAAFPNVTRTMIETAQQNGLLVNPWTVNEYEDMKMFLDSGIDGIITDFPNRWIECSS